MKTHPHNPNLHIIHGSNRQSRKLLPQENGFIEDYLESIEAVMNTALEHHPRTLMIRCDLHFPRDQLDGYRFAISRFLASLKAQIEHDQRSKYLAGQRVHDCQLRYIWAKEQATSELPTITLRCFSTTTATSILVSFSRLVMPLFQTHQCPILLSKLPIWLVVLFGHGRVPSGFMSRVP
mgnify:CR=1 FL=1